ncbi:transferrin-binding protein-like solute binding protein [Neisseria meningitidis]|uniref:transferrin-binding protein-like solute binding protein n=1 Tax=Neisseria meningitidis TaxID=487 RepID=UPI00032E37C7|nr:transferrin-binding protein-like solute binding protein [Neisseria meningitidis]EOB59636.1 transferrin binding -like solute binding family protein [Neisseria meningitidis 61106]
MTIPFKPSLLAMASILALSACISGGGGTPVVKSSETPSNKVTPPPAETVNPTSGGDGGESKTEIPSKDTQGEGETAQAGADGGVQNDAPQHNDNVPANGTSDTQPEKERMPDSDAVGSDGGNQDVEKDAKSQDDTEEKFVSENPDSQDKQVQSAADTQPKTGVFGEKYFDGTGEITALVIGGETIDLTKANEPVSRNHPGLMSDFDKVMVSQNQYKNLIYGAVKLKDGSYTLFVQGQPTENNLPEGKAKYQGKVLHFRSRNVTDETDWLEEGNSYRTTGTFAAEVDFGQKSVKGTINSGDGLYMGTREFTAKIEGSGFKGKWDTKEQGDVEGKFYGSNGDEMAGRYSFNKTPDKNDGFSDNGFGVFAGKKEANVR